MKVLHDTKFPNYYVSSEFLKDEDGEYTKTTVFHKMGHGMVKMKSVSRHLEDVLIFFYPMTNQETDTFVWFRV